MNVRLIGWPNEGGQETEQTFYPLQSTYILNGPPNSPLLPSTANDQLVPPAALLLLLPDSLVLVLELPAPLIHPLLDSLVLLLALSASPVTVITAMALSNVIENGLNNKAHHIVGPIVIPCFTIDARKSPERTQTQHVLKKGIPVQGEEHHFEKPRRVYRTVRDGIGESGEAHHSL
jgi:hypothetical protein